MILRLNTERLDRRDLFSRDSSFSLFHAGENQITRRLNERIFISPRSFRSKDKYRVNREFLSPFRHIIVPRHGGRGDFCLFF